MYYRCNVSVKGNAIILAGVFFAGYKVEESM